MADLIFDLFGDSVKLPLEGVRVCLTGSFRMDQKELTKKLKSAGAATIDRVSDTRTYKEGDAIPPVKETTGLFVVGTNPNEDSLKRYALNAHDGYKAVKISEDELYDLLEGKITLEIPIQIVKCIDLTYDYYDWTAPVINDKNFVSRGRSLVQYDLENKRNVIVGKEIFVPDIPGVNMNNFRQLIGNLGGFANGQYLKDTDIVMLSDETIEKWKDGIKDDVIRLIEKDYNESQSKIFTVQFTCESDFLAWVKTRLAKFPDSTTSNLLNKL